jgi:hypothetical protein
MGDFNPATRATSHNARGHKRRIGQSKRSSYDPAEDVPVKKRWDKADVPNVPDAVEAEYMPSLVGASSFFRHQRQGAKGIRGKVHDAAQNGELLQISQQQYDFFLELAAVGYPDFAAIEELSRIHGKQLHNLAWLLLTDSNVLLYGIGNKQKLIKELVHTFLEGEDVIEVSTQHNSSAATPAPTPEQLIKSILGHIERTVLKNKTLDGAGLSLENRAQIVAGNCCYLYVWFVLRLRSYFARSTVLCSYSCMLWLCTHRPARHPLWSRLQAHNLGRPTGLTVVATHLSYGSG